MRDRDAKIEREKNRYTQIIVRRQEVTSKNRIVHERVFGDIAQAFFFFLYLASTETIVKEK